MHREKYPRPEIFLKTSSRNISNFVPPTIDNYCEAELSKIEI